GELALHLWGHDWLALDQDRAAAEAFEVRILGAMVTKYPPRHPDPVAQRPRRHDGHVEQTSTARRVGQQLKPALQPTDIADQHRAGPPAHRPTAVDLQPH